MSEEQSDSTYGERAEKAKKEALSKSCWTMAKVWDEIRGLRKESTESKEYVALLEQEIEEMRKDMQTQTSLLSANTRVIGELTKDVNQYRENEKGLSGLITTCQKKISELEKGEEKMLAQVSKSSDEMLEREEAMEGKMEVVLERVEELGIDLCEWKEPLEKVLDDVPGLTSLINMCQRRLAELENRQREHNDTILHLIQYLESDKFTKQIAEKVMDTPIEVISGTVTEEGVIVGDEGEVLGSIHGSIHVTPAEMRDQEWLQERRQEGN
jgi:chromosome segregation ATPase